MLINKFCISRKWLPTFILLLLLLITICNLLNSLIVTQTLICILYANKREGYSLYIILKHLEVLINIAEYLHLCGLGCTNTQCCKFHFHNLEVSVNNENILLVFHSTFYTSQRFPLSFFCIMLTFTLCSRFSCKKVFSD